MAPNNAPINYTGFNPVAIARGEDPVMPNTWSYAERHMAELLNASNAEDREREQLALADPEPAPLDGDPQEFGLMGAGIGSFNLDDIANFEVVDFGFAAEGAAPTGAVQLPEHMDAGIGAHANETSAAPTGLEQQPELMRADNGAYAWAQELPPRLPEGDLNSHREWQQQQQQWVAALQDAAPAYGQNINLAQQQPPVVLSRGDLNGPQWPQQQQQQWVAAPQHPVSPYGQGFNGVMMQGYNLAPEDGHNAQFDLGPAQPLAGHVPVEVVPAAQVGAPAQRRRQRSRREPAAPRSGAQRARAGRRQQTPAQVAPTTGDHAPAATTAATAAPIAAPVAEEQPAPQGEKYEWTKKGSPNRNTEKKGNEQGQFPGWVAARKHHSRCCDAFAQNGCKPDCVLREKFSLTHEKWGQQQFQIKWKPVVEGRPEFELVSGFVVNAQKSSPNPFDVIGEVEPGTHALNKKSKTVHRVDGKVPEAGPA